MVHRNIPYEDLQSNQTDIAPEACAYLLYTNIMNEKYHNKYPISGLMETKLGKVTKFHLAAFATPIRHHTV